MISALLSSRVRLLSIDEQILNWLQQLELIDSYDLHPTSNTGGKITNSSSNSTKVGPEVGLTDVGFGVSQVLPVLILCYYAPEGSILILEQPEAHLHPKVQSELADVLIDVVKNRNVQIILESHSEHLLTPLATTHRRGGFRKKQFRRMTQHSISARSTTAHPKLNGSRLMNTATSGIGLKTSLEMRWATWWKRPKPKCSGGK